MICFSAVMEQMKPEGYEVVAIDYSDPTIPESVQQTRPLLYIDGDAYCCILGPNPETGIFGRGPSISEALDNFDRQFQKLAANPIAGDPVSEFIQGRHV
jgi:hypothetical protein